MLHAADIKVNGKSEFFLMYLFTGRQILDIISTGGVMEIREKRRNDKNRKKTVYQALITVSQFGIYMLVPIFLCFFAGLFLDRKIGTSFFMILLFFVGALAGFRNVFLLARRIYGDKEGEGSHEKKGDGTDQNS